MSDHLDEYLAEASEVPLATADFLTSRRETGTGSGFPEDVVLIETPSGPVKLRVRGLSRHETLHVQAQKGVAAVEQMTISLGVLEPRLTTEQVKAWQKSSVGAEMDDVTRRIGELSGMLQGSRKAAIKEFLTDPGAEFRVHAGDEAGHDGDADATGDAA